VFMCCESACVRVYLCMCQWMYICTHLFVYIYTTESVMVFSSVISHCIMSHMMMIAFILTLGEIM